MQLDRINPSHYTGYPVVPFVTVTVALDINGDGQISTNAYMVSDLVTLRLCLIETECVYCVCTILSGLDCVCPIILSGQHTYSVFGFHFIFLGFV